MPHPSHAFGDVRVTVLCDAEADVPISDVVEPGESPSALAELPARFPEEFGPGGFRFRAHGFLIRTPEQVVVVDTGIGDESTAMAEWVGTGGRLPSELSDAGVDPADVGHVVMTHSHGDHVGWNTIERDGRSRPCSRTPAIGCTRAIGPARARTRRSRSTACSRRSNATAY